MPGIYIHIPFCKQACHYCNFHFSTSLKFRSEMVEAILQEMEIRKHYLGDAVVDTIYFGGGTPSLLDLGELNHFFEKIYRLFPVAGDAEITLEANPDDLTHEKLKALAGTPVNRLSIGVQSFSEADLRFFNRAHNAIEARACIEYAQDAGFENLTVDLIYGAPTTDHLQWSKNLQSLFDYGIPHISAYCLTVEPQTALQHFVLNGKMPPVDEEKAACQFEYLMEVMEEHGYEHYEISNFALPGHHSRHNSSYWEGAHYLGLGPSAHSFDGRSRQWNVANNMKYIKALTGQDEARSAFFESEVLTPEDRYNEYVMTALRTIWGLDSDRLQEPYRDYFLLRTQPFLENGTLKQEGALFFLTRQGKLLADRIAVELFYSS